MSKRTLKKRVRELMAEWELLRFGLSEHDAAEAWAESMAIHEETDAARAERDRDVVAGLDVERLARAIRTAEVGWTAPVARQHAEAIARKYAALATTPTEQPRDDGGLPYVQRTFAELRHRLVGTPPNVDAIDAAIGYALNDCEATIRAALTDGAPDS